MHKHNLKGMSLHEIKDFISELGKEVYRSKQIFKWIYQVGINSFEEMSNISKKMRTELSEKAFIDNLDIEKISVDNIDDTKKLLIRLKDNNYIETVIIPDGNRITVCVSSQAGCALDCSFCATGKKIGYIRNLSSFEIIEQLLLARHIINKENKILTNVVFMGMGEPFNNFDNVIKVCDILNDQLGFGLGCNRITVSTAGIVPKIIEFANLEKKFELAISLNAPFNELRNKLMPINKKYPLEELLKSVKYYNRIKNKELTFEYVMLKNINDTDECLDKLRVIGQQYKCKINLIRYNDAGGSEFLPSDQQRVLYFFDKLNSYKVRTFIRKSKGSSINGACGQLAANRV